MAANAGIEIDFCPACRGVWLDRGELDKIIARSTAASTQLNQGKSKPDRYCDDEDERRRYKHERKRRGGFIGEIFDF
jgi:Zn-finger nucleic acid-binding protein